VRCLWLAGECPDVADTGLHVYSRGISEAFARTGADVTGIGMARGAARRGTAVAWRRVAGRRRRAAASLLAPLPAMAHGFATPEYRRALDEALGSHWDAVVIDHLQTGWAVPVVRARARRAVLAYVSQNHEASVRREVARAAGALHRLPLAADAWKVARLERRVTHAAKVVTAITDEDAQRFRSRAGPTTEVITLPPGYDGHTIEQHRALARTPRRAVVLGSFEWHVKEANLRAFLAAADPLFADAGAEIRVVGPVRDEFVAEMRSLRATTFAGRVPDITSELGQARIGVIAETLGGGFKMKALDYAFHRVPIAMIAGSANGLPLRAGTSVLEFTGPEQLASGAARVLDRIDELEAVADRAFDEVSARFDWSERGQRLREAVERQAAR